MRKLLIVLAASLAVLPLLPMVIYTGNMLDFHPDEEIAQALFVSAAAIVAAVVVGFVLVSMARPERGAPVPAVPGSASRVFGAAILTGFVICAAGVGVTILARGLHYDSPAEITPGSIAVVIVELAALYPLALAIRALYRYGLTPASYSVSALRRTIFGVVCILGGALLFIVAIEELRDDDEKLWAKAVAIGLVAGGVRGLVAASAHRKAFAAKSS